MTQITSTGAKSRRRIGRIVLAYPFAVSLVALALNEFVFGLNPAVVELPSRGAIFALTIAAILLVINHAWLMTATELTRLRYRMYATPEEWANSGARPENAPPEGVRELARHHSAHRNTTENAVYFVLLAGLFVLVSPPTLAAQVWLIGFAVARLGYSHSYLSGRDGMRGIFMSLSLVALFGMASYLLVSLMI